MAGAREGNQEITTKDTKPGGNGSTFSLDCGGSYTEWACQSLSNSKFGMCVGAGGKRMGGGSHWFYLIFLNFLHCSFRVISEL